jgi:hypothetical protein
VNLARVLGLLAVTVAAAVLLAGCSGDDDESAEGWANSVCAGLSAWLTEVEGAVESLTDEGVAVNEEDVETAVDQVEEATATLVEDLDELELPETEGGEEAQRELENLSTELRSELDTVREAVDSEAGTAGLASTVSSSVSEAFAQISSTLADLREVDSAGELVDGFDNADECDTFREQLDELGS